jgi:hypothetical protein
MIDYMIEVIVMYSKYCERFVDIMGVKPAGSRKEYFDA